MTTPNQPEVKNNWSMDGQIVVIKGKETVLLSNVSIGGGANGTPTKVNTNDGIIAIT